MSRRPTPSTASCSAGWKSISERVRAAHAYIPRPGESRDPLFSGLGRGSVVPAFAGTPSKPVYSSVPALPALVPFRGEAQAQRLQADETLCVALVVHLVFLEGDVRQAVEAVRRLSPDDPRQPLVELQPDPAFDLLLALVDQRLQHLALGREPEAVVDQLGVARHQLVLQMHRAAVEAEALDAAMRRLQDRAARGLIDAARFHADKAVPDQVEPANAALAADLVAAARSARPGP